MLCSGENPGESKRARMEGREKNLVMETERREVEVRDTKKSYENEE